MTAAMNVAINIASGTPPYYVACNLCQFRGIDPHGQSMSAPIMNWQHVIVEQLLGAAITEMLFPTARP